MKRDPHYRKIVDALVGPLDGAHFQRCANELLQETYPGLAPVAGGNDAGMDGTIGEDGFLVVTTGKDVLRNLTKNIDSHLAQGGLRRRVVIATSQEITGPRRRKLEARAVEKGFILVNVHDRNDFAARLYRNSKWARDLLGVTGDPPALSALPSGRLLLRDDLSLIGRDADLKWLRESAVDRVLVGQPGSGKTHLLLTLVREGRALFLASNDETRIANDLRDLQPEIVLVDDAHADPPRLERLRRLREELGARFDILATAWPGYEDEFVAALGHLGPDRVRRLEGVTRAEIAEVLRAIGVDAPDDDPWFRFMVDQSRNRPGLAVLLGTLWLRGESRDVLSGKALSQSFLPALRGVLRSDPVRLLACFAVGGEAGMRLETIAKALGIGLDQALAQAVAAAHGGVLESIERGRFAVQPAAFRSALLAEVFFTAPALVHRRFFEKALEPRAALEALVAAAHAGSDVPAEELQQLVLAQGQRAPWHDLAVLSELHARWVLEHYPGQITDIAAAVLPRAPSEAIQRLLRAERVDDEPLHSSPRHPHRLLQDWVQEIHFRPGSELVAFGESLRRRALLVAEVERFLSDGGDREMGIVVGLLALSPVLQSHRMAYTGGSLVVRHGNLPVSTAPRILELWQRLLLELTLMTPAIWRAMDEILHQWTYPWSLGTEIDEEIEKAYRSVAAQMVRDLATISVALPGFLQVVKRWSVATGAGVSVDLDEDLAVLYPSENHITQENWQQEEESQRQAARLLADRWSSKEPEAAMARLAYFQREAKTFSLQEGDALFAFYRTLAAGAERVEDWLRAAVKVELEPRLTSYFLSRVVEERPPGWDSLLRECLQSQKYGWLAAGEAIGAENLPDDLLSEALEKVPGHLVETACLRGQVPPVVLKRLLLHSRQEIAEAAAEGIWDAQPKGEIPAEIEPEWRAVVLGAGRGGGIDRRRSSTHWLKRALSSRSDLALSWLRERLCDVGELEVVAEDGVYAAAIRSLGVEARKQLVDELEATYFNSKLLAPLVGSSPEVYRHLLDRKELADHHLAPLVARAPDAEWTELARVALDAGHEPDALAAASLQWPGVVVSFGEVHWRLMIDAFEELRRTSSGGLQEVAERGRARAEELLAQANAQLRHFEMTGRH